MCKQRNKGVCGRNRGDLIYAPEMSFLGEEESRWIIFVNLLGFWNREGRSDYIEVTDHIILLLHQYLDVLQEDHEVALAVFEQIAQEINHKLGDLRWVIAPNPLYLPDVDWTDPSRRINSKPFLYADPEGTVGSYASLGRFLAGRYVHRLGKCRHCGGLFIAPDDEKHETCPDVN